MTRLTRDEAAELRRLAEEWVWARHHRTYQIAVHGLSSPEARAEMPKMEATEAAFDARLRALTEESDHA